MVHINDVTFFVGEFPSENEGSSINVVTLYVRGFPNESEGSPINDVIFFVFEGGLP